VSALILCTPSSLGTVRKKNRQLRLQISLSAFFRWMTGAATIARIFSTLPKAEHAWRVS